MSLKIGIVGLPNVGKSTLFNALTRTKSAKTANYPFCTIDPNVGVVEVPDERLENLAKIVHPLKIIPAVIEFVDIAGLVKGASQGEGLGNKFLSHIRECQAVIEIVRCFEDSEITHVHGSPQPKDDILVIESELLLADLQTLASRINKSKTTAKSNNKVDIENLNMLLKVEAHLNKGYRAVDLNMTDKEQEFISDLHLLTMKPFIYVLNIKETQIKSFSDAEFRQMLSLPSDRELIPVCAKLEQELGDLPIQEAEVYLKEAGLQETGLNKIIHASYRLLGLETFFTAGPKEVRAWTIKKNTKAPQAAGVIHTDFERGFIMADVISYGDYIDSNGELGAKERGLLRQEGREYVIHDGDVAHFRFNV